MERTTQISSMQPATCGKSSLTSTPDCPYFLNSHGERNRLPVLVRSSEGLANGRGLPLSVMRRGFGSNVSTWDGPPNKKRKMTRFAFAGNRGAWTARGFAAALEVAGA